jgi:hypothetical protein
MANKQELIDKIQTIAKRVYASKVKDSTLGVTPDDVSFDKERPVFVMQRGGGGGGKTGDSISSAAKGGNAAYVEVIIPADKYWATIIASGGSGPSALDVRTSIPNYSGAQGYPLSGWGGGANLLYYLLH